MMPRFCQFFQIKIAILLCVGLLNCSSATRSVNLPPPIESTSIGRGDVLEFHIFGEENLYPNYTVAPDGSVDLPFVNRIVVDGLEPQQAAELIRDKLIKEKYFQNPSVSINVKEYNSKKIQVLGEVQKPGALSFDQGMTLIRAISLSGGFNALANKDKVTVLRKVEGKTISETISVQDIFENKIPDVYLQPGDTISVAQRVF